ncbi:MAG: putative toxin-antitoxin system toxin component, PIN family [Candidatus Omnitrophica bacterium]|nr:putative toxin-antitoxin system toxin component, PIN family [Candidatus Omnitrophota bacterium]
MKLVLDTNVLISAIMFGGKSREILEMGISGKIKIATSQDILKEFAEVLVGKKFRVSVSVVQQTIHELSQIAEVVIVTDRINLIKNDPDDNRILECALSAKANYIVSGDSDLLTLKKFKRIKILSPNDFLLQNLISP